jgi:hypothetical protein
VGTQIRRRLTAPEGYELRSIDGINNSGRIIGSSQNNGADWEWYSKGLTWSSSVNEPPTEIQPYQLVIDAYTYTKAIDDSGRIVGSYYGSRYDYQSSVEWKPPYTEATYSGQLGGRAATAFTDISPTTNVSVGTARDSFLDGPWPPETAPPMQAQIWDGSGPVKALPRLSPDGYSGANAMADDGRAGGSAVDAEGQPRPVVWTCALQQAYLP